MQNINIQLSDAQEEVLNYLMDNGVVNNPRMDFRDWLQGQFDQQLSQYGPMKDSHIQQRKMDKAIQMVDLDIVDKMQEIIDVVKLDKTATYTLTAQPVKDVGGIGVVEEVIP